MAVEKKSCCLFFKVEQRIEHSCCEESSASRFFFLFLKFRFSFHSSWWKREILFQPDFVIQLKPHNVLVFLLTTRDSIYVLGVLAPSWVRLQLKARSLFFIKYCALFVKKKHRSLTRDLGFAYKRFLKCCAFMEWLLYAEIFVENLLFVFVRKNLALHKKYRKALFFWTETHEKWRRAEMFFLNSSKHGFFFFQRH